MSLTLEQKTHLLSMTRRPRAWRPMLVAEDGRVVRDMDVYVSPVDRNAQLRNWPNVGAVIQVRRED